MYCTMGGSLSKLNPPLLSTFLFCSENDIMCAVITTPPCRQKMKDLTKCRSAKCRIIMLSLTQTKESLDRDTCYRWRRQNISSVCPTLSGFLSASYPGDSSVSEKSRKKRPMRSSRNGHAPLRSVYLVLDPKFASTRLGTRQVPFVL